MRALGASTLTVALACSGASSNNLSAPGGDASGSGDGLGSGDATGSDDAAGSGDAKGNGGDDATTKDASRDGAPKDGSPKDDASDGSTAGQDSGDGAVNDGDGATLDSSDAAPPPCPDVSGGYTVALTSDVAGCGSSLNVSARQCVRQSTCHATFQSTATGGANIALTTSNNAISLQSDGSFTDTAITEGTSARTGCTGTWDMTSSTFTVDCGGMDSGQSCVLTLHRTGSTCP